MKQFIAKGWTIFPIIITTQVIHLKLIIPPSTSNSTSPAPDSNKLNLDKNEYYHIRKDSVDRAVDIVTDMAKVAVKQIIPNMGAGAAAGAVASAVIKSALPPGQNLIMTGVTAGVVGCTTKIGLALGDALISKASGSSSPLNPSNVPPSPTEFFVPSILEKAEILSPLEQLIQYQLGINLLMLILIIILIFLLCQKFLFSNSSSILISFIKKNLNTESSLKLDKYKKKIDIFNESYFLVLFTINSLTLLFNIFLSIVISSELTFDLAYYIQTHNELKNSFCLLLLPLLEGLKINELKKKKKKKKKRKHSPK
jgi:hypothetical protein